MNCKTQESLFKTLLYLIIIVGALIYNREENNYSLKKFKETHQKVIRLSKETGGFAYKNILIEHILDENSLNIKEVDSLYMVYLEGGCYEWRL